MFGFDHYRKELLSFCIPDVANIIMNYVNGHAEFTKDFIQDCITNKEYLFYNKDCNTLLNWMFNHGKLKDLDELYCALTNLEAKYLQNKDNENCTELWNLCYYGYDITKIQGLKIKHFLNISAHAYSELWVLCDEDGYKSLQYLYNNGIKFKEKHCNTNFEIEYLKEMGFI